MVRQIEKVLAEMGWTEGFHIPVANKENKELEDQLEEKLKRKAAMTMKIEELNDRIDAMNKHMKSLVGEYDQNQSLITAHCSQMEAESHMIQMAQTERTILRQEKTKINKMFSDLWEQHQRLQSDIVRHTNKLEKLKVAVKWDKDMLMAWEEEFSRFDDNNSLLQRYVEQDESKAKEMELQRQRLRVEVETRTQQLKSIIGEVVVLEHTIEQTALLFRNLHKERQQNINQWEASVAILKEREKDIRNTIEEISNKRTFLREKEGEMEEQKTFHENEIKNNIDTERQISSLSKAIGLQQESNRKMNEMVDKLEQEMIVVQRTLEGVGMQLMNQRTKNRHLVEEIKKMEKTVMELKEVNVALDNKMVNAADKFMSSLDRTKHLNDMLELEVKKYTEYNLNVAKMSERTFTLQQQYQEMMDNAKLKEIEMKNIKQTKLTLQKTMRELQEQVLRHKELIYNVDYQIQTLESRVARLTGNVDIEKKEADMAKLDLLEKELAEKKATLELLIQQSQRLEDTKRNITSWMEQDSVEQNRLLERRQDQLLTVEGGKKQLEQMRKESLELQVEENVLKLRVKQLENTMQKEGSIVYSLEKQKLELDAALKERQVEIGLHNDMLKAQKKVLCEEKSRLTKDIGDRRLKIGHVQKKYDNAVQMLGKGEDGKQLTLSEVKVKYAQEKYEMQVAGDDLDEKIHKAEKEIGAMENTLMVVKMTNDTYKRNLDTVDLDGPEVMEKSKLEKQQFRAKDQLRERHLELDEELEKASKLEKKLEELKEMETQLHFKIKDKEHDVFILNMEFEDQMPKLERAEKQIRRLIKDLRGVSTPKVSTLEEKDINLRELQDINQCALQQLAELVACRIETGPLVTRYLSERELSLPVVSKMVSPKTSTTSRLDQLSPVVSSSRLSMVSSTPSLVTLDLSELQAQKSRADICSERSSLHSKKEKKKK